MKKVALYFGSFNPIHIGHLALANYLAEYGGFDEVRFVVSLMTSKSDDLRSKSKTC